MALFNKAFARLLNAALSILGSLVLVFFIIYMMPGDPVLSMLDPSTATPEAIENMRIQLGLDRPFYAQFADYFTNMVQGDFGQSLITSEPVLDKILLHLPATLALTLASVIFSIVIGVAFGVLSAVYRNRWLDSAVRIIGLFGISMPTFWSGILLILIFSVQLNWLPVMGSDSLAALVLPSLALGFVGAGFIIRMVRSSMVEVLDEQFILTLRAKGLSERLIMYRHALRNALIPAVTVIGLHIGELLAGTVVIETVFSRQGIGRIVADAIMSKDMPVIQGVIFFSAIVYVIINLLVDLSYSVIDPRIRKSAGTR
ncbi:ABC transporter permease [Planomicrobium sp. CPCC 101110]|uniref:ABC transporter permease n=1 Tax=Planomicrobium sp. CPCC 101110 TaxID=2599619 RepID=UPI0011B6EDCA|nr:ABC transporter permease [Planomicrobium sp. CPCC 101110]TWT25189.1 ABC transporter permease [Planomicrobium sp. CPCC 101110]